jgi:pimeloyl-ACP methyl ester carboxylesterase
MAELALKQATIEYQQFGPPDSAHPPVLFVHGILVDGRLWRDVAENLARRGFRCIVPTWPLGSHTIPVNEATALSLHGVAEIIKDAIVALDLSDVTLVGSDTGGGLCQLVVDAYPDRIGRLVLTNCDAFDKCPPYPFDVAFGVLRGPLSIKALMGPLRLQTLRHSSLGYGLLINQPDPHLTAAWLQPSVTLVWGQLDRCFTPSLGRRLAALFSNGKLIEVPDAKPLLPLTTRTPSSTQ